MNRKLRDHYHGILMSIGEDPTRDGLLKTSERAAEAMLCCCDGYYKNIDDIVNGALFSISEANIDQVVMVKSIEFYSLCEHHLMPFFGKVNIAYTPSEKILGLSKFARIVDMFSHRLQTQENLTFQIAEVIQDITLAKGIGVIIEAEHLCMKMRGIEKQNSTMVTYKTLGSYNISQETRQEFFKLIR